MAPIAPVPGSQPDTNYGYPSASPEMGKLVARHAIKAQDPAFMPHMARRNVPQERTGAAYGVTVQAMANVAPEAGATQANGRILKPAVMRSAPNFLDGMGDHN